VPSEARHPRDGAEQSPRPVGPRIAHAWRVLDRDRRLAAVAALALFATMLLPWYQQNAVVSAAKGEPLVSRNLNAFAVFSFVEAAVLLVAVAVLVLLYERADGRTFHLPGGDGSVVFAAGAWAALLLVLRLFDKPGIAQHGIAANVGVQWGIFFALGAAGLLAYAGSRMRSAGRPGPPLLRREADTPRREDRAPDGEADTPRREAGTPRRDTPAPHRETTAAGHEADRPRRARAWEPDSDSAEDATVVAPARTRATRAASVAARERPRFPPPPSSSSPSSATPPAVAADRRSPIPASAEQLSFDDSPAGGD
jgi:hypothetical protein